MNEITANTIAEFVLHIARFCHRHNYHVNHQIDMLNPYGTGIKLRINENGQGWYDFRDARYRFDAERGQVWKEVTTKEYLINEEA